MGLDAVSKRPTGTIGERSLRINPIQYSEFITQGRGWNKNYMSYRNTYTTQFLYKHGQDKELAEIRSALEKYCRVVEWQKCGSAEGIGYFHGFISGLYQEEVREQEAEILAELEKNGIRIKIVYE